MLYPWGGFEQPKLLLSLWGNQYLETAWQYIKVNPFLRGAKV